MDINIKKMRIRSVVDASVPLSLIVTKQDSVIMDLLILIKCCI